MSVLQYAETLAGKYADAVGALVLINPEAAPTADELPREEIVDEDLRALLALVPLAMGNHEILARLAWENLRTEYVIHLLKVALFEPNLFHYRVRWYAFRMREIWRRINQRDRLKAEAIQIHEELKEEQYG